jgi:hypothetical protein
MEDIKTSQNGGKVPDPDVSLKTVFFTLTGVIFSAAFYFSALQEKTDVQINAYATVLRSLFLSFFVFCTAFGIGSWIMHFPDRFLSASRSRSEHSQWFFRFRIRCFFSFSLGLGTLGFIVLGLGSLNLLRMGIVSAVFILFFLLGFPHYRCFFRHLCLWLDSFSQDKKCDALTILGTAFLTFIIILYFICALPLPIQYDVLEYHLGSLCQSLGAGSIKPQPYVFYSYLPFGMESLYAAGLLLEGKGIFYTPKFLNWECWLLSLLGLYVFFDLAGLNRNARIFGMILFGLNRLVFSVALDAFVEPGQTVYVLSALCSWMLWWRLKKEGYLFLSFLFWGLALGVKFSILGLAIIPFMAILVPVGLHIIKSDSDDKKTFFIKNWIRILGLGGLIVGILFLPWMIRNFYHTGNPFFPFLSRIFPWENWTPEQMKYYIQVNRDVSPFSMGNLRIQLTKWNDMGAVIVLPIFLIPLLYNKESWVLGMAGFAVTGYIFLNAFIQPPARFLVPLIPVFILLTMLVFNRLIALSKFGWLFLAPCLILIVSIYQLHFVELFNSGYLKAALFSYHQDDFLFDQLGYYKDAADFINEQLPEKAALLSLYEARSFYIERGILANTVFDKSPLLDIAAGEQDAQGIRSRLLERGITHVLVNEIELNRQIHMYAPKDKIGLDGDSALWNKKMVINPLFQDPYSNLTAFEDLYGPYHIDSRFQENRGKIREFIALLQDNILFERIDDRGLRFYISRIDNK